MKKSLILTVVIAMVFNTAIATIRYVKPAASGTGAGTSWANASGDLQLMINGSVSGDEIWVAAGTYKPNRVINNLTVISANNRNNAFVLKSGVKIYGGFAGIETALSQRNLTITANASIISGDFGNNDGANFTNMGENAYHVLVSSGTVTNTVFDGFTITGANYASASDGSGSLTVNGNAVFRQYGGAIYVVESAPTLSNLAIKSNNAYFGSGLYVHDDAAATSNTTPAIINCIFSGNRGTYGGAVCNFQSRPTFTNTLIYSNVAIEDGGGIYSWTATPTLTNVTVVKNSAKRGGGFFHFSNSNVTTRNTIIYGNTQTNAASPTWQAQVFIDGTNTVNLNNNIIQNWDGGFSNGNLNATGVTTAQLFDDYTNNNFRLKICTSPAINSGSNTYVSSVPKDLDSNTRINDATVDLGVYEYIKGATLVWKGTNNNWNDPSNWDCAAVVPTSISNVTIPVTANNPLLNSGTVAVKNITFASGTSLSIAANATLTINGTYTNNGSSISNNGTLVMAGNAVQSFPGTNGTITAMNNLQVNNSAGMVFNKSFEIKGTLTPTLGNINLSNGVTITLHSDAVSTASVAAVQPGASISYNGTGKFVVERYIPNNGFRSWRLLSVPVVTNQTIRQAWQEGDMNPNPRDNNLPGLGTQITGVFTTQAAAAAAGFDSTSVQSAMLSWNGTNWSNIISTNQPLNTFNSYFLFVRGDRGQTVTGNSSNSSATTLRSAGTIYTGDKVNNVDANTFALIPNLYPSAINFTGLARTGGVGNLFYVWDSKKLNGNSLGAYQTFSATNSFNCLISGGSYILGQPNTTIESGQSFFVQGSSAGTITLKETAKVSSAGSLGFRPSAQKSKIDTRLYNANGEMLDAGTVVLDELYSKSVSSEDAPKMGNPGANLAIETGGKLLAIEGTQPLSDGDNIQYRLWNLNAGTYKLEIEPFRMSEPGASSLTAYLEDSYLKSRKQVSLDKSTAVNFVIDQKPASSSPSRFRLVFAAIKTEVPANMKAYTIAPNPVENGVMNLRFNNREDGKYNIRVINRNGQTVMVKSILHSGGSANYIVTLPNVIAGGNYTLEVKAPGNDKTAETFLLKR